MSISHQMKIEKDKREDAALFGKLEGEQRRKKDKMIRQ